MSKNRLKNDIVALHHSVKNHIIEQLFQDHAIATHHVEWASSYLEEINVFVHCTSAIACAAVGGDIAKTFPLIASWYLFVMAADIYDDIQDADTEKYTGADDEILSFALFLVALSYQSLCQLDVPLEVYRKIEGKMRAAYLSAASGQLKNQTIAAYQGSQNQYLANIIATTSTPLAQYYACGTYFAGDIDPTIEKAFYEYGIALGTCSQLKDDLEDLKADLFASNFTLPILYGLDQQDHPLFQELNTLIAQEAKTETDISRIIEILERMDSIENVQKLTLVYMQCAMDEIAAVSHLLSTEALVLLSWKKK